MIPLASRRLAVVCGAVLIVALPVAGSAQSLADVARAEQARRKQQSTPSKVYTNDSVKTDITPSTPSTPAVLGSTPAPDAPADATPATADTPAAPAAPAAGTERRDEAYWKGRITSAREQLERSKTFAESEPRR